MTHRQKWEIAILAACVICLALFSVAVWLEPMRANPDDAAYQSSYSLGYYFVPAVIVAFAPLLGTWLWRARGRRKWFTLWSTLTWLLWLLFTLNMLGNLLAARNP